MLSIFTIISLTIIFSNANQGNNLIKSDCIYVNISGLQQNSSLSYKNEFQLLKDILDSTWINSTVLYKEIYLNTMNFRTFINSTLPYFSHESKTNLKNFIKIYENFIENFRKIIGIIAKTKQNFE